MALSVSISVVGAECTEGKVKPPSWGTRGGCTGIAVRFFLVLLCVADLRLTLEYTSLALCRRSKLLHSLSVSE